MSDAVFPGLKHKNPRLREQAMRDIAATLGEETLSQLMAILSAEDVTYRRAAVQTLGVVGPKAVPLLAEQLVENDNSTVRASCAKALAAIALSYREEIFPQVGIEALTEALKDPDPVVRLSSIGALSTIGEPVFAEIQAALDLDDLAVAMIAINTLGTLGGPKARVVLSGLAQDETAESLLRESAAGALSRLSS